MMFYNPHSYDDMMVQLQERQDEMAAIRAAESLTDENGVVKKMVAQCGALLVRIGTWMQQFEQPAPQDSQVSA